MLYEIYLEESDRHKKEHFWWTLNKVKIHKGIIINDPITSAEHSNDNRDEAIEKAEKQLIKLKGVDMAKKEGFEEKVYYQIEAGELSAEYPYYWEVYRITQQHPEITIKELIGESTWDAKHQTKDEAVQSAIDWIESEGKTAKTPMPQYSYTEPDPDKPRVDMRNMRTEYYWLKHYNLPERYQNGEYKKLYIVDRDQAAPFNPFKYGILAELQNGEHLPIAAAVNKNWIYSLRAAIDLDFEHIHSDNEIYPECAFSKKEAKE